MKKLINFFVLAAIAISCCLISTAQTLLEVEGTIHSTTGGFKFPDGSTQITAALWTPVKEFGAVGNGTADDYSAIQQAINSGKQVSLSPNKTYLIKNRLVIGDGQILHIPVSSTLKFDATSLSFAAIEMTHGGTLTGRGEIVSSRYSYDPINDWDMSNGKAAISISGGCVRIDIGTIRGFEIGINMSGNSTIFGCNIHVGTFYNNVICVLIYPEGNGFVNQNYIHIDQMAANWGSHPAYQQSCGIYMDCTSIHAPNANTFSGHIEGYKKGIHLAGNFNRLEGLRMEACETKIHVVTLVINGIQETVCNYLFGEYGNDWSGKLMVDPGISMPRALQSFGAESLDSYSSDDHYVEDNVYANNYLHWSDSTLKRNIQSVHGALNKILSQRGTTFEYKSKTTNTDNETAINN